MTVQFSEGEVKELNVALTPIPIEPAQLIGQVVDADTSAPIAGVLVEIVGLASATTASDGSYSIINIPPGSYTVRFMADGYEELII